MSNFSQKHTKLTKFYLLSPSKCRLKSQLRQHSKCKKAVLVIPLLASEYTDPENRSIFANILKQLRTASYLSRIILGVDQAEEEDLQELGRLVNRCRLKNCHLVNRM